MVNTHLVYAFMNRDRKNQYKTYYENRVDFSPFSIYNIELREGYVGCSVTHIQIHINSEMVYILYLFAFIAIKCAVEIQGQWVQCCVIQPTESTPCHDTANKWESKKRVSRVRRNHYIFVHLKIIIVCNCPRANKL